MCNIFLLTFIQSVKFREMGRKCETGSRGSVCYYRAGNQMVY